MIQYFSKQTSAPSIQLKQLPNFKSPNKLTRLSYPNNLIRKIPPSILSAHHIQYIDLSHNKLTKIQKIFHLQELKYLNLSHNQITQVHKELVNLKSLQQINLSDNRISKLQAIKPLEQLFKVRKGNVSIDLEGNEVVVQFKIEIQNKFDISVINESITREKLYQHQNINVSQSQTTKMIEFSEKQENGQNFLQMSPQFQNLSQQLSMIPSSQFVDEKKELQIFFDKFSLLSDSINLPKNENIAFAFKQQAVSVLDYIQIYKQLLIFMFKDQIQIDKLIKEYDSHIIKVSEQQRLIKDLHQQTIYCLSQNEKASMEFYRVWVHLYRKLRQKTASITKNVRDKIEKCIRQKQLQNLMNISPQKNEEIQQTKDKLLEVLLYSKKKRESSQVQDDGCVECFIKVKQMNKMKDQVKKYEEKKVKLEELLEEERRKIKEISKQKENLENIVMERQQHVIKELQTKIDASTYQKILLEQAQGIEEIIKINSLHENQNNIISSSQNKKAIQTTYKNIDKGLIVSEFTSSHLQTQGERPKLPYFNQSVKGSRNHTQIDSTEKKKRKKSKQLGSTGDQIVKSQKSKQKQNSRTFANTSNKRNTSNALQPSKNSQILEREYVTEFLISQPNKIEEEEKKQMKQEIKERSEKHEESYDASDHVDIPFRQSSYRKINVNNEEPYKNYMKYHLRNSIIETLNKKGRIQSAERIINGNKYQMLINSNLGKKMVGENSRSQSSHRHRSSSTKKIDSNTYRVMNNVPKTITYRKLLEMTKKGN